MSRLLDLFSASGRNGLPGYFFQWIKSVEAARLLDQETGRGPPGEPW